MGFSYRTTPLTLGETVVESRSYEGPRAPRFTLVHLHANERTALRAGRRTLSRRPVRLHTLHHDGGRFIRFRSGGRDLKVDPNRVFSRAGVEANLRLLNGEVDRRAVDAAVLFGEQVLHAWSVEAGAQPVVALHNNTNDGTHTIRAYGPGEAYAAEVAELHVGTRGDPDDFYFVTRGAEFEVLSQMGYSVALQSPAAPDDGSLSLYCLRRDVPYVNIEAQHARRADTAFNELMVVDALYALARTTR